MATQLTKQEILRQRADILSRKVQDTAPVAATEELVCFSMAGERYGVVSRLVGEITPLRNRVALPGTPSFVWGITNLRRRIVSLVNLHALFGIPGEPSEEGTVVLLSNGVMEFGLVADTIDGVAAITLAGLQRSLPGLIGPGAHFLLGLTPDRRIVIDAEKLLTDPTLVVRDER